MAIERPDWRGVFPAVTTQFNEDLSIDFAATRANVDQLISEGVHGIVALGTCGENNSLSAEEKRDVLRALVETSGGRIPVIAGVSEFTTSAGADFTRAAAEIGANGLMVLPAMVYTPSERELVAHFRTVAEASDLPIMIYNNPAAYRVNVSLDALGELAKIDAVQAIKESSEDIRRITDIFNAFGDRFVLFAGLDDVAMEAVVMGAQGWVSGLTNAFPQESLAIWSRLSENRIDDARTIYRWFADLLHLDARPDLVQCIKLVEQEMGRGSERVRPPRYELAGDVRAEVMDILRRARETRPELS